MTKFVIAKEAPEKLSNYEMVIAPPTLLQEVQNCWNHRPANGLTGVNWLRQIANEITKWDKMFNTYRHCIPSDYQGIPFSTQEEVAAIVVNMINDKYPNITDTWVEHCVKSKPAFTKLVWFIGDFKQTSSLTSNFIDRIELKEVEAYMGRHAAKLPDPVASAAKPAAKSQILDKAKKPAPLPDSFDDTDDLLS